MRHTLPIAFFLALAVSGPSPVGAQDPARNASSPPEITLVRGDLYMVRSGAQATVFVVTPDGIVLGDPLGRETALWLRDDLSARFHRDVRFVLHTSHLYTRAEGSSVFNDTADVVAHRTLDAEIKKARRSQPERYRFALRTTLLCSGERQIVLDGRTVEMIHVPSPSSPEMMLLYFPRERAVFAPDPLGFGTVPFSFEAQTPGDVFAWVDTLSPLEFDSLLLGDGRLVSRAEFDELATYLSALRAAVVKGKGDWLTLSRTLSTATLDEFRANPNYAGRTSQLSDIHAAAQSAAVSVSAGAAISDTRLSPAFCASHHQCAGGGAVSAARFTASTTAGTGFDVMGELTLIAQTWSARGDRDLDVDAATRRTRGAVLFRYGTRASGFLYGLVGGASLTVDGVRGVDHVKWALAPAGGGHPFAERNVRFGVTVGGDIERVVGRGITIRVPVRITRMFGPVEGVYAESTLDLQAGVDVTFRLSHRVNFR